MRSHSVAYPFKSQSDFFYLTGLRAVSVAYLVVAGKHCHLLLPEISSESKLWEGEGEFDLPKDLSIEPLSRLDELLAEYCKNFDRIAFPFGRHSELDGLILRMGAYHRGRKAPHPLALVDCRTLIGILRLHKDETEIECLCEAGQRSSRVHRALMSKRLAGQREIEIANWIEASFLAEGMSWRAYGTIVGAGERTTILHARATERMVKPNDLVLIDAGGEWQGYCADITRTLPANGKFSNEQRAVYEVVLKSQKAAITSVRPGVSLEEVHLTARENLMAGLRGLGMSASEIEEKISILQPHGTSHWIGLDVHDPAPVVDDAGRSIRLEPGMCLTVEPGLYFREPGLRFSGIGIRIEDDVLVTAQGHEILTSVPKEISEIEELCSF